MAVNPTFQIKRGMKATMPTLSQGEFGFAIDSDSEELFIGTGNKNIQIARQDYVDEAVASSTPVKGVDYFTESDISEIVSIVLEQLPAAEEAGF